LAWDKISAADYEVWRGYEDFSTVIKNSQERMSKNPQIKLIEENARWVKEQQNENVVSLNFDEYRQELEADKKRANYFKKLQEYDSRLSFSSLKYEESLFTQDPILREKRDRWHRELARDVYVEEAINVLEDLKMSAIRANPNRKLASSVKG